MFNLLLNLFKKSRLKNLKIGDIILAKRYKNDIEKNQIEEGHQNGPFIVIKKKKNTIYALYCTGANYEDNVNYILLPNNYNLSKQTYIYTSKEYKIEDNQYIKLLDKLNKDDLNKLNKIIYLKGKIKKIKYEFSIGDIIKYNNNLYYVFNVNKKFLQCYTIFKKNNSKNPIIINDVIYSFDLYSNKIIKNIKKIKLIDMANESEIKKINIIKNKNEKYRRDKHIIERGDLIKYNDNYYYIYGETGNQFNTYIIYLSNTKNEQLNKLYIHRGYYFSKFEEININKNADIVYVKSATEDEINIIKLMKKENNMDKKNINKKEQLYNKNYQEKCIIADLNMNKYLIIGRKDNIIKCYDFNTIKLKEFNLKKTQFILINKLSNLEYQNYLLKIKKHLKNN